MYIVIIIFTLGLMIWLKARESKKNHINSYSVILFWVKKVVKKEVLREWGFGFSLR